MASTSPGQRILVEFRRAADRLTCTVRDTGRGLDESELACIFDRFYSVKVTPRKKEGAGLGLHIVQRLLELHGGGIEAESSPGEGSTFTFWIPPVPRPREPGGESGKDAAAAAPAPAVDPLIDDPEEDEAALGGPLADPRGGSPGGPDAL
jgi:hypothetical protein